MRVYLALTIIAALAACRDDETVAAYGGEGKTWALQSLDGSPYQADATLSFPETGRLAGQGPCNAYFAEQTAPYPWFKTGPIGATKRACSALKQEGVFFAALADMSLSEVSGDTLILSNDAGREMLFKAVAPRG